MLTMSRNRIQEAIVLKRQYIKDRLDIGAVTQSKLDALDADLNISMAEYVVFQQSKSEFQAGGVISCDEAMTIYAALGFGPGHFNMQDLATKVVLTGILEEMLARKIA